jgi:hypothetical protein
LIVNDLKNVCPFKFQLFGFPPGLAHGDEFSGGLLVEFDAFHLVFVKPNKFRGDCPQLSCSESISKPNSSLGWTSNASAILYLCSEDNCGIFLSFATQKQLSCPHFFYPKSAGEKTLKSVAFET